VTLVSGGECCLVVVDLGPTNSCDLPGIVRDTLRERPFRISIHEPEFSTDYELSLLSLLLARPCEVYLRGKVLND
jgi:hypothetical protein